MADDFNTNVFNHYIKRPIKDRRFLNIVNTFGQYNIGEGPWIAGGAVRKLWQGVEWDRDDIDVFFSSLTQFEEFSGALKNKYKSYKYNSFPEIGVDTTAIDFSQAFNFDQIVDLPIYNIATQTDKSPQDNPRIDSIYSSDNAETFTISGLSTMNNRTIKIQAICRFFPVTAVHLLNDFDWTICKFVSDGKYMWASPDAAEDVEKNEIILSSTTTRNIKIPRLMKYLSYGFDASDELMLKALHYLESGKGTEVDDDY